ncbi:transporter substrate-binding domain-containing protein [Clostridium sp. D33t1_170424_F3]|uniref:transporter substrate-binding domain-containing protein n=1 Tax=Clostridium sp. D33t1_170424_F3 TaxID=2787099 RepID=UPI002570C04E|nr:transporter substrate-binding domain-containing protein [Clostridium sp. D33t1_170424_F3]
MTMGKRPKNWIRRGTAALLTAFLTAVLCTGALAAEQEPRVLQVPFPEVAGLTETAADGSRHGLVVDYLNEIAKYTGWEYEYIDADGDHMIGEFLDGKYDLMGGNYYSPGFEEYFAYPDYNIGYSKSILMARRDDGSINSYDLRSLNGKTIGVYERAVENIRRLQEFLSMHNLNCELRIYSYEQLPENGKLYPYLKNGEVDLLLGNGFENPIDFRTVASFDSQPYYIVTHVGDQEILDGLNMALEKIADSNPNFSPERYAAHFQDRSAIDIQLNEAEREYVQGRDTVTVAVPGSYHPLFCLSEADTLHNGIVPDTLAAMSEFMGLTFTYVTTDSYSDAVRMVQEGKAELLGFYLGSEEESV